MNYETHLGDHAVTEDHDDQPTGRVLSRREVLALLGAGGTLLAVGHWPARAQAALPACVVRPEQTEGPFFVDAALNRSDIRSDPATGAMSEGVPLELLFLVSSVTPGACAPLAGALVDVWQCDAAGVYSGVMGNREQFLRGHQTTDESGQARFVTIYPGWYPGRTVHIHFKLRADAGGVTHDFTSQLYFDDALTDAVYALSPYAARGARSTRNAQDGIYRQGGDRLTLEPTAAEIDGVAGYRATFDVGLQLG
jgi:protocatechuate 3,4-dioxygenase beta subunit